MVSVSQLLEYECPHHLLPWSYLSHGHQSSQDLGELSLCRPSEVFSFNSREQRCAWHVWWTEVLMLELWRNVLLSHIQFWGSSLSHTFLGLKLELGGPLRTVACHRTLGTLTKPHQTKR